LKPFGLLDTNIAFYCPANVQNNKVMAAKCALMT